MYCAGTKGLGLFFNGNTTLEAFSDSSWSDVVSDKLKSTGGYLIVFSGSVISHSSFKTAKTCASSAESELMALHKLISQFIWIRGFIDELEEFNFNFSPFPILTSFSANANVTESS